MVPLFSLRVWPSDNKNIDDRGKNVGVRRVQICVKQLEAGACNCAVCDCAALPLLCVASNEIIFYEHPDSSRSENIELYKCAVVAINFVNVRS
jgi:hypothetical protein